MVPPLTLGVSEMGGAVVVVPIAVVPVMPRRRERGRPLPGLVLHILVLVKRQDVLGVQAFRTVAELELDDLPGA